MISSNGVGLSMMHDLKCSSAKSQIYVLPLPAAGAYKLSVR